MVHKPYTPHNDVNFTRTGKEIFHEYTVPLCVVMPKLHIVIGLRDFFSSL
jgi:hypothetical protein